MAYFVFKKQYSVSVILVTIIITISLISSYSSPLANSVSFYLSLLVGAMILSYSSIDIPAIFRMITNFASPEHAILKVKPVINSAKMSQTFF